MAVLLVVELKVTLHLEMNLSDLMLIVQLASRERIGVEQFIQKCIQFYIDERYNKPPQQEEKKDENR